MEARRLGAIPKVEEWRKPSQLSRDLKVSRTTLYRWRKKRAKGEDLKSSKATGRPGCLTADQIAACKIMFYHGQRTGTRWTGTTFADEIESLTGVRFSSDHAGRLMHKWGLR